MIDLPIDIIIIIINFLSFDDVIKLMALFNYKIFEACRFYRKINIGLKYRQHRKLNILHYFYQPEELIIKNGSCSKNYICYAAVVNKWQLKKVVFNNIRSIDSEFIYNFLDSQKNIETLELYLCNVLQAKHLLVINENIKNLSLRNNLFKLEDIKHLTRLKRLKKLDLSYSRYLFDTNIDELFFDNLEILHLSNTQLTLDDRFFSFLAKLTKLKELNLDFVITSYQKFLKINKICPKLEKFSFLNSINIVFDPNHRSFLTNKWLHMKSLNLSYCLINDDKIIDIVDNCSGLKELNINHSGITDVAVIYITIYLKNMEKLFISTNSITNISANHIAIYLTKLTELDISHTIINDYYAKKILKNNINMERISVMECPNITYGALRFGVKQIII